MKFESLRKAYVDLTVVGTLPINGITPSTCTLDKCANFLRDSEREGME